MRPRWTMFAAALVLTAACTNERIAEREGNAMPARDVTTVMNAHVHELMSLDGVVGVAIGELDGVPSIQVLVVEWTDDLKGAIPESLEGHPVDVQVTGTIEPF